MQNDSIDWKQKFNNTRLELEEIKIAYSNLLHDVLSFNELISKKNNPNEILTLVLRLARTIIDFSAGAIFSIDSNEYKLVHSININDNYKEYIDSFLRENKYESILINQRLDIFPIDESHSRIVVPVITKQQALGLLDIFVNISHNKIKQQDLDLLWILTSIAAIEFESLEMSNRSELLSLMLTSLESINSEDKLDKLLYLILNNLRHIVPASSCLLILRDKLLEVSESIHYCITEIHSLDETCHLIDEVIINKSTLFIKKLSEYPQCCHCTESYLHKECDGTLMLVPLYKGDTSYGVISIFDKNANNRIFNEYNRHIIEIFAKQATIAINNAILYDQQKKSNLVLAATNDELSNKNKELDAKKNEILYKQELLQKAHDEVSHWNKIINKELESAGVIQSAILSKSDTPENLDLFVNYKPHHSIGGDYFGVVAIDQFRTIIYIGDVSGKGVPAAITTGFLKNEFSFIINQQKYQDNISPGKILSQVNLSAMSVFKVTEQFTSAWCGLIDTKNKKLTFASAGHDYPLLIQDSIIVMDYNNGPIMGLTDHMDYKDLEVDFKQDTKLFLYTDGITDQETTSGNRVGREWLVSELESLKNEFPEKIGQTIFNEIEKFSKNIPQHDDMLTIVVSLKKSKDC